MLTNKFFIQFYFIFLKKEEDEYIYIIQYLKLLLISELEIFYLSLEDAEEFFQNDLYMILYNK